MAAALIATATAVAQETEKRDTLETSFVTAVKEKMRNTTQTGLMRIDSEKLRRSAAVFGTPDIVKTLQTLPGVAAGNELMSGLYVHGGDGNDNLFLLDGVPLYNISHFGGFFSSFNTDVVQSLDFYKSGFPARYGGRLSSVVDVETEEGGFNEYHGGVSLGAIDGRIHLSGPIVKDRCSFNLGYRRSWMDIVTKPLIAWANRRNADGPDSDGSYAMSDLNARVTYKFSGRSRLNASVYWGRDRLRASMEEEENGFTSLGINTVWGSLACSAAWDYKVSDALKGKLLGYYSRSGSDVSYDFKVSQKVQGGESGMGMDDSNAGSVYDIGLKYDADWYPGASHHVRFGGAAVWHGYGTERNYTQSTIIPYMEPVVSRGGDDSSCHAIEPSAYIEDEIFLRYNLTFNAGVRLSAFVNGSEAWWSAEPRAAMKWLIYKDLCTKLSYTRMSQYNHLVSAMYIDLPTNSWMPSTKGAGPMVSDQVAGGLYFTPGRFIVNLEGWYKTMRGILSYNGANAFYPPLVNWEKSFTSGRGESYGLEFEGTYRGKEIELSVYYTLGWSWREFQAYSAFPFPDHNDNRHKINITGSWKISEGVSLFFNWNYHTGNRITLPSHVVIGPEGDTGLVFQAPYNASLPDYHRLDAGLDIEKRTRRGNKLGINVSVYNLYNHLNASFAMLVRGSDGKYSGMAYGLIPIIPTFSISYTF